jgi:hypothetical protein
MKHMKLLVVTLAALAVLTVGARAANADTILVFGQLGTANTVTGSSDGNTTTITGTNIGVSISALQGFGGTLPIGAFLNFTFNSTAPVQIIAGESVQPFSGVWSITSSTGGGGVNYLSGAFTDLGHGSGNSFTLNAGTAGGDTISPFTSSVITTLGLDRALSFAFTNVTPPIPGSVVTRETFSASVAGNFSANLTPSRVPEPMSLVLLGSGLLGLSRRRLWRRKA